MAKIPTPLLKDESVEGFDRFTLQFDRYLRVSKVPNETKVDLLLLCVGDRVAGYFDEVT